MMRTECFLIGLQSCSFLFHFLRDTGSTRMLLKVLRKATSTQQIEDKCWEIKKRFHLHIGRMSNKPIPALPFCHVALKAQKPLPPFYPKSLKTLGDHLKKKRLDLKLRQSDVAPKLGVDETSVHNWERGHTTPSVNIIPKILNFLGYNPFETETKSPGKRYRRTLGLTQKEFAGRLKIDPGTLRRWEKGEGRLSKESFQNLVDFFASLSTSSRTPALVKKKSIC